jgi:hypothetical protein
MCIHKTVSYIELLFKLTPEKINEQKTSFQQIPYHPFDITETTLIFPIGTWLNLIKVLGAYLGD